MSSHQKQSSLVRSKGSSFLNSFWDLVSDCSTTREQAASYITNYLINTNKERDEHGKYVGYNRMYFLSIYSYTLFYSLI